MSIKGKAYIAGAFEHPTRKATDKSVAQLHAECAQGALKDAGLTFQDVDGYFCAGDAPGLGPLGMSDYMNLKLRHLDSTDTGGSSYIIHVAHAAQAIAMGKCNVALITLAGRPRSEGSSGLIPRNFGGNLPDQPYESLYALAAARHMYEFGTTLEQLAWVKVAASHHAQWNENAMLRDVLKIEDVMESPVISDPLRRMDCCVVSDGGGALIVTRPEIAKSLKRPLVKVLGAGEAFKGQMGGLVDLTYSGGRYSGAAAFEEAGVKQSDIKYASIYDSFTITVIMQLEDLGFCKKGEGGKFVADGNLISGVGKLPFNTDGGGITKVIEAVRQLRGEAHPKVQVKNCDIALAHGTGGSLGTRHGSASLIMERA